MTALPWAYSLTEPYRVLRGCTAVPYIAEMLGTVGVWEERRRKGSEIDCGVRRMSLLYGHGLLSVGKN